MAELKTLDELIAYGVARRKEREAKGITTVDPVVAQKSKETDG